MLGLVSSEPPKIVATTGFGLDRKNSFTSQSRFRGSTSGGTCIWIRSATRGLFEGCISPANSASITKNPFESSMGMRQAIPNRECQLHKFNFVFSNHPRSMDSVSVTQPPRIFWTKELSKPITQASCCFWCSEFPSCVTSFSSISPTIRVLSSSAVVFL